MKRYLFIYLFIYLFSSCNTKREENSIIPKELNKTWVHIKNKDDFFYQKCSNIDPFISAFVTKFQKDVLRFSLMSDEWETVKEVIPTKKGYKILFKEFRYDAEFRFSWADKKKRIALWEYINNEEDPAFENQTFYAIDSINYHRLPPPPCIECFPKEKCDEMIKNGEW